MMERLFHLCAPCSGCGRRSCLGCIVAEPAPLLARSYGVPETQETPAPPVTPMAAYNWRSLEPLSERERNVAIMIALGITNPEIAERLLITVKTVGSHRGAALRKLGVRNNVELTHLLLREKHIELIAK